MNLKNIKLCISLSLSLKKKYTVVSKGRTQARLRPYIHVGAYSEIILTPEDENQTSLEHPAILFPSLAQRKLPTHALPSNSHSTATCITHTFLQTRGGRGENNSCNLYIDLFKHQTRSYYSGSSACGTTCPFPAALPYTMRQYHRRSSNCQTAFHHCPGFSTPLMQPLMTNTGRPLVTEHKP